MRTEKHVRPNQDPKKPKPWTLDFETEAIEGRPTYPPKPVGFALKDYHKKGRYYSWGHPAGNNCTEAEAKKVLREVWASGRPILFHNAKFDVDVAEVHLGLKLLPWHRIHDTMFLVFLHDPHAPTLALKPTAERLLGMPPDERDAVKDWLVANKIVRKGAKNWGAFICKAPGDLVGKYAVGDIDRTEKLFDLLYAEICERNMREAYNRECRLLPILLQNEREGIRVDVKLLKADEALYTKAMATADAWLRKALKAPDLNIDSDEDLADALEKAGVVEQWNVTKTGQRSTSKKNLTPEMFKDKKIARALGYRNRLATCLGTFMRPWLAMSEKEGRIYTNWNQVKQPRGSDSAGAKTGRMSTNPNFQNIPKNFYDKDDGYEHPKHIRVPELPLMRKYILPDEGEVFIHRDYNQQELRILAHFEDGSLLVAYKADPRMDVHDFVRREIERLYGLKLERRAVKILNFGMIYGMGLAKLAIGVHTDVEGAKEIKKAQRAAIPGLHELEKETKRRGKEGLPIRTWGGREYFAEEPKIVDGQLRDYSYKLLNYLIQGSAADCTKEAIIAYDGLLKKNPGYGRFLVTVHDEINVSAPKDPKKLRIAMELLRTAMESIEFDVPMLSDGKFGPCWGDLKKYEEPETKRRAA